MRNGWSEVAFCSRVLRAYGIRLTLCRRDDMPDYEREFDDVHYDGTQRRLWLSNDRWWLDTLWHEVGHCVSSDEASRAGMNWVDPYPFAARRNWRKGVSAEIQNERDACDASAAALEIYGADDETYLEALSYVNAMDADGSKWKREIRRVLDGRGEQDDK